MLENIKAIFFDADDTIVNHKECERKALEYLFKNIGEDYKEEYQDIFRPLDRELWDSVTLNASNIPKELIPEYMMNKTIIFITGDLASGKTSYGKKISHTLKIPSTYEIFKKGIF